MGAPDRTDQDWDRYRGLSNTTNGLTLNVTKTAVIDLKRLAMLFILIFKVLGNNLRHHDGVVQFSIT